MDSTETGSGSNYILLTFQLLDILPITTLYGFYGLCLFVLIAVFYPVYLFYHICRQKKTKPKKKKRNKNSKSKIRNWIEEKVNVIVLTLYGESHYKLRDFLEDENENKNGVEESEDTWKKAQLSWLAMMIRINALSLLFASLVAFWERFLVERSIDCDDEKHCFLASNDTRFWNRPPIPGCSNITENQTVVCFQFVYKIGDAVGLAGGILTYGIYDMKFGGLILLAFYKQIKKCCSEKVYRAVSFVIQQAPITTMLVIAVLSMCFARYRDLAYYGSFVEAFGISSVLALVIATPWSVLVEDDELEDEDESAGESDSGKQDSDNEGKVVLELDLEETKESMDDKDDDEIQDYIV